MLNYRDNIGRVPTAYALSIIDIDSAILKGGDSRFNKARFIKRVSINKVLDIIFIIDAIGTLVTGLPIRLPT